MLETTLDFISREDLLRHVKETVGKYRFQISLKGFNKNLVDPIKLNFDAAVYGKSVDEMIETEIIRQIDKSNTNHIGYFYQNIFKYIGVGWEVLEKGFDVANADRKICVEMKTSTIRRVLNKRSSDLLESLYLLAFKKYEGFGVSGRKEQNHA